jgi:3-oxoacyl-[acyl-carrier-protein] synthase II
VSTRRVVITGLGAVTPLANNVADTWDGIINGKSGIGPIDSFDISSFATTFGGVIRNFNIGDYISEKDACGIPFEAAAQKYAQSLEG